MPLQDHFRPPLSMRRHWHAFHNSWATYLSSDINQRLPPGYFAEANVQFGIEIDVATFAEVSLLKSDLYASAFRPVRHDGQPNLDIWQEPIDVGRPLPTLALWLRGGLCLPVNLETTYERTCREQRVAFNGESHA